MAPELAELAILVTARHWQTEFEWHAHARLARAADIREAVIEAIRTDAEPTLAGTRSRAVYALARELYATRSSRMGPTLPLGPRSASARWSIWWACSATTRWSL